MYDGDVVKVIKMLKFERAKAAASPLARILCNQLPLFCEDTIIVPVPTTSSRVRQRGYNQSMLIAKHIGKEKQLKVIDALGRDSSVRQLGASRQKRHEQIKDAFYCKKQSKVVNRDILLIDDVVTTGATLKAAAKILYASGAANIYVATVAKTPPASVKQ
ncbi:MAG: phosphoribosyltransferase family protein [Candidatus Woesebacteria bacterium]|jgi:competence protein ComFC